MQIKRKKMMLVVTLYWKQRLTWFLNWNIADPKRAVRKGAIPPLHIVEDFLLSLTNSNTGMLYFSVTHAYSLLIWWHLDGRITLTLNSIPGKESTVEIKYQLLNPSPHFMEVVEEARSVVLAGGTMSPVCFRNFDACNMDWAVFLWA